MSRDALELSPDAILAKHGIPERHARTILSMYFGETWPRIAMALERRALWGSHSRLRAGKPWRHAEGFNCFIRAFCTASTDAETIPLVDAAADTIIRRLGGMAMVFAMFGHQEFDGPAYILPDVTPVERASARSAIADLLSVDDSGEPLGLFSVEWFADWRWAMHRTVGPFLSHARMLRSMS